MSLERSEPFEGLSPKEEEFAPLNKRPEAVGDIIDSSSGRPVLTGRVYSSSIMGSEAWFPNDRTTNDRIYITDSLPGYIFFLLSGESNDDPVSDGSFIGHLGVVNGKELSLVVPGANESAYVSITGRDVGAGKVEVAVDGNILFNFLSTGAYAMTKFYPPNVDGANQGFCGIYAGNGVPGAGTGANGDYYYRGDGTIAGTHIYHKTGGAWVGIV